MFLFASGDVNGWLRPYVVLLSTCDIEKLHMNRITMTVSGFFSEATWSLARVMEFHVGIPRGDELATRKWNNEAP
ncbi:unnamed protein product [Strongylus vulgaris]|uniref:Uncharacterized protein n=1 Tax=Strongylus vulgaris TaxID=40348 RepID=A0A3P7LIU3_STRVU|nr:unnamed protein product [Strongylus vulgaris]